MKNRTIAAAALAASVIAVAGVSPAVAAPSYDSPYDVNYAKRATIRAFYGVEYSTQRNICRQFNGTDSTTVYVVRKVGRIVYNNTPDRISLREAQKGVIKALVKVC